MSKKAGPSRSFQRLPSGLIPRHSGPKSSPTKKPEVIDLISSDEEEKSPKPKPTSPTKQRLIAEVVIITSSDSDKSSKKRTSSSSERAKSRLRPTLKAAQAPTPKLKAVAGSTPSTHRFKRTLASASSTKLRYTSSSQPLPAIGLHKDLPHVRKTASAPTVLDKLPPLPSSSSPPHEPPLSSPVRNITAYRDVSQAAPVPSSDADIDADSTSSGDIVETSILLEPPQHQDSRVLGSSLGDSSNEDSIRAATVPREPPSAGPSSPAPSHTTDRTAPDEELEESIANVSLYDGRADKGKAPDSAVAQAVAAVGSVNLGDGAAATSEASEERFMCSIGDCPASFPSAGQLHTHTSRDHGVKLSQNRQGKGKRKARDDSVLVPSKRRTTGLPLERRSRESSASNSSTDRYVKRKQTVGFDSFVQKVSDHEFPSPSDDVPDATSSSHSSRSPSPPSTPAPPIPKLRAPHPNMRTIVPDSPSSNLSPSKQIAQTKDSILIEGEQLETWRVDLVNSMPESYRKNPGCRAVFEAYMDDEMRKNEPCAPAIVVENEVDSEPCPPWEFVYYNRMVYGTNVPKPDKEALVGCDCLGPCNPNNRNCACVQRQERYYDEVPGMDEYDGFACRPDGEIKYHGGAIFGCNSKCSCDAECSNRVLQQGRKYAISIKKTRNKGWGVFAKENIPPGQFIGIYTGELLTEGIVNKRSPVYDEFGRTYVLNIDFAHIRANKDAPTYAVDAFHAGNFTRFFNHSCQPNLFLTAYYCEDVDIQKPLLALFCDRFIKAGEELTFSYTGLDADDPEDVAKSRRIQHEEGSGKVFEKCLCGAPKCFGFIFTGES